jgi:phage recombination protein Bet
VSTAIAHIEHHNGAALAPVVPQDKVQLLIDTVAPGLSKPQLALFVQVCNRVRLDPFAKQIYAIIRNEWDAETRTKKPKMVIQTGIDGYRTIAERTGELDGGTLHEWCGPDGEWRDVWLDAEPPAAARATVYRKGRRPQPMVARWGAYVQTKADGSFTKMWTQRGPEQLAKCAEALALRLQFPDTMEGVYTSEEMAQADSEPAAAQLPRTPAKQMLPPPKAADGPRVPESYTVVELRSKPLAQLAGAELGALITWLEALLADDGRKRLHAKARGLLVDAERIYNELLDAEAARAQSGDPIAEALQRKIDERSGINEGDQNPDWGMGGNPAEDELELGRKD